MSSHYLNFIIDKYYSPAMTKNILCFSIFIKKMNIFSQDIFLNIEKQGKIYFNNYIKFNDFKMQTI